MPEFSVIKFTPPSFHQSKLFCSIESAETTNTTFWQGVPQMEIRVNFVECLQIDVVLSILTFLDEPADLIRASAVSHSWRNFVITHSLCKKLCLRKAPPLSNIGHVVEEEDGMLILNTVESGYSISWKVLEREHKMYSSLLQALANSMISPKDCIGCVIGASSTDREPEENIVHTLLSHDRYTWGSSYWSSKGQCDPCVPESILFKLNADICVVTEIGIRPFQVIWEPGRPVYSATSVRFRMGHPKSQADLEVDIKCLTLQQLANDKYVWTYTSPEFPMSQEYCLQPFKLPEPALCIGGFLKIELLGRAQREEIDGLYYLCVSSIKVLGRPLKPAFELFMGAPEKLLLKYYPDALNYVLQNSSDSGLQLTHQPEGQTLWSQQIDMLMQRILVPHEHFLWQVFEDDMIEDLFP